MLKIVTLTFILALASCNLASQALILPQDRPLATNIGKEATNIGKDLVLEAVTGQTIKKGPVFASGETKAAIYDNQSINKIWRAIKNFFVDFINMIGKIIDYIYYLMVKFYKLLYPV